MQNGETRKSQIPNGSRPEKPLFAAMVIDKSGSMRSLAEATVDGFNEYLASAKVDTPDAIMSLTLFDTTRTVLFSAAPVAGIPLLTEERYCRGGMGNTALNDALAETILAIEASPQARTHKILVAVTTDGFENASTEWNRAQVSKLVKTKETVGWKFVFFGANMDAQAEGDTLSVPSARSVTFAPSPAMTTDVYRRMSRATTRYARGESEEAWAAELKIDTSETDAVTDDPARRP